MHAARDCAGFGWAQLAQIKRHPQAQEPKPEAAEVTQRWYDAAYKLHRVRPAHMPCSTCHCQETNATEGDGGHGTACMLHSVRPAT